MYAYIYLYIYIFIYISNNTTMHSLSFEYFCKTQCLNHARTMKKDFNYTFESTYPYWWMAYN